MSPPVSSTPPSGPPPVGPSRLRARLDDIHRGIAALDAELDVLDGPETPNIRLFLEWSRWLESTADAATVLAELLPDPRRRFLAAEPAMSAETAQRMLDVSPPTAGGSATARRSSTPPA